jgi:hypothetical protein
MGYFPDVELQYKGQHADTHSKKTSPPFPSEPSPHNHPLAVPFTSVSVRFLISDLPSLSNNLVPILEPIHVACALMFDFEIVIETTVELPEEPYPLPIPDRYDELLIFIVELQIVRETTVELPHRPYPMPILAPHHERRASIIKFEIVRVKTEELS